MIVATASPEQPLPHTGAFVGDRLGLRCGSFDLARRVRGLRLRARRRRVDARRPAAATCCIVGAETVSRLMDPTDRATSILFGDGAGAAVIVPAEGDEGLLAWDLGCDGSAARPPRDPGRRLAPAGVDRDRRRPRALHDDGGPGSVPPRGARRRRLRDHDARTRGRRPRTTSTGSCRTRRTSASSKPPRTGSASRTERTVVNIERYGNTSSASIPLALFEAVDDGRVQAGRPRAALRVRRGHDVGERADALGRPVSDATHDTSPALVTGGSKGIGAATCVALARQGHPVTFCYGSDDAGAANTVARDRGRRAARRSRCAPTSSDAADVDRLFGEVEAAFGPVARAREQRRHHARRTPRAHDRRPVGRGARTRTSPARSTRSGARRPG